MKKLTLWLMAFAAWQGSALEAQNLTGNWQGTLQAGAQKVRILFKIALENDKLTATLYTVDRPSPPIPATIAQDGSTVKLTIPAMNGKYEGKLSADGNSIVGTLTMAAPLVLNLARATPETAWAIPEPPPPPVRMAADANPSFEVATIKPSDPARPGQIVTLRGVEVITTNTTLHDLINLAYWLHPKQLAGGPAWTESDKWDLTGKPDAPGQPNVDQMKVMIQKLLADRFQLKFHFEKRELLGVRDQDREKPDRKLPRARTIRRAFRDGLLEEVQRERCSPSGTRRCRSSRPCCKTRWMNRWWISQASPGGTTSR